MRSTQCHRHNGQATFCTLGFGLGISWESKMIQRAILNNRIAGLGEKGDTPLFPKLVFAIKKGTNFYPSDDNYDIKQLALECTSKRIYPDILNFDQVVKVTGSFKTPMGCRSFLGPHEEDGKELHEGLEAV
jgi:anaerobic ribonucleoside-triphosphate reductase